ncbi:MAG: cation diffusion facilitator family transporter [Chitinophagales bacterium]|nr:cation diffusion facilitator family transporter [Chitinophagales bacterium]
MNAGSTNIRIQTWVVAVGILLLIAKFIAYLLTHSNAILTDALESIVNIVAGGIGLYSLQLSAKPRDADHPYGHGKIEFISASIEGTMVLFAGLVIIGKSVYSFIYPQPLSDLDTGIFIILATALINYGLGFLCIRQGSKSGSPALSGSGAHLQSDAFSTFGIIAALVLIYFTGLKMLDNIIAIGMGIFICFTGYQVVRKAIAGIMDEADYDLLRQIISQLNHERHDEWVDLHNMRVIKYGNVVHIDCHLTLPWYINVREAHEQVSSVDESVKKDLLNPVELFIHTDPCVPQSQCRICINRDCHAREAPLEKAITWNLETSLQNKKHGLA